MGYPDDDSSNTIGADGGVKDKSAYGRGGHGIAGAILKPDSDAAAADFPLPSTERFDPPTSSR